MANDGERNFTMRMDRFTALAQESLASAQSLAASAGHSEFSPLHLLGALLTPADSGQSPVTASILAKSGVDATRVRQVVDAELKRLPTVSGTQTGQSSPALMQVLTQAEKEAKSLKDGYVSTEHLLLALADVKTPARDVLNIVGLDRKRLLAAIEAIRKASGVTNVNDPNAESTME